MYGRRKYGRKIVEQQSDVTAVPTFICPRCNQIKTINTPHIEFSALENGKIFIHAKVCELCSKALKEWFKKS